MEFLGRLQNRPLVFDGGVGTQLSKRGVCVDECFALANLKAPERVAEVHRAYVDAGADAITTNTFSANRDRLEEYGLADRVAEINRRGVEIARWVAGPKCFVAASVGPTGRAASGPGASQTAKIGEGFAEQVTNLVEAGADLIAFETFRALDELRLALKATRQVCALPILAQVSVGSDRRTADGAAPTKVVELAEKWGADVVGVNCTEGPDITCNVAAEMAEVGPPIAAESSAGFPREVGDRLVYPATPEDFASYARHLYRVGVRIVGGCCGAGPAHVERISRAAKAVFGSGDGRNNTVDETRVAGRRTDAAPASARPNGSKQSPPCVGELGSSAEVNS